MLSKEQIKFLNDEFDVSESNIEKMSKEEWVKIKKKSYDIMRDEMLDENDDAIEDISERGIIAESITDIEYSMLKEKNKTNMEESSLGKRMANIVVKPGNRTYGSSPYGTKPSKWMEMAMKGEITEEEAKRHDEEELMQELGLNQ